MQTFAASSRPLSPTDSPAPQGVRFVVMCLMTLPPLVAALAGSGLSRLFSALIFMVFGALVPATLYIKRGAFYLALASAVLLVVSFATIPLESAAFSVDRWATFVMFLLALTAIRKSAPSASSGY